GARGRVVLFAQQADVFARAARGVEEAVDALQLAAQVLLADDAFDGSDGRDVARRDELRRLLAVHALELRVAAIERAREVRRRARRLPAGDRTVVEDDRVVSGVLKEVRRRQAEDAGADDADRAARAVAERRAAQFGGTAPPDRLGVVRGARARVRCGARREV